MIHRGTARALFIRKRGPLLHFSTTKTTPPKVSSPFFNWVARGTLVACLTTFAFVSYNSFKPTLAPDTEMKLRKLPPVDKLLDMDQVQALFSQNQQSFVPLSPSASVARIDLNSLASNDPIEDRHSQHESDQGVIVGIYDGHGGFQCADVVSKLLVSYVAREINTNGGAGAGKSAITSALKNAFVALDKDITTGCLQMTSSASHWWDVFFKPSSYASVLQGIRIAGSGSCAIVCYAVGEDVYVASTGDCRAVLGRRMGYVHKGEPQYQSIELSKDQTAVSPTEFSRMCEEHPGEDATIVVRGRVLGGLQPSRAFGDARYKWPISVQEVLTPHLGRRIPPNLLTPPYVTAEPEVTYYKRDENDEFIVLACDGLWDDMDSNTSVQVVKNLMGKGYTGNYSTALMIAALSGNGRFPERVQHSLSIPAPKSRGYRDDMTVSVLFFPSAKVPKAVSSIPLPPVPPFTPTTAPQLYDWVGFLKNKPQSKL
ncbi:[Pyruvate dehydrogenase [acetyl-transferring]]-phosphatase 1, mitochondrial [Kappamyces sp. JEL0680]|nr:[Pyruvate dehydrogenase [acetyl-transferring]]-phosphatase 1, mitochondrial [Kappamyces sp. JEL0680]